MILFEAVHRGPCEVPLSLCNLDCILLMISCLLVTPCDVCSKDKLARHKLVEKTSHNSLMLEGKSLFPSLLVVVRLRLLLLLLVVQLVVLLSQPCKKSWVQVSSTTKLKKVGIYLGNRSSRKCHASLANYQL